MANAATEGLILRSAIAGEALARGLCAKLTTDGTVDVCDAVTDVTYGIVHEKAAAGEIVALTIGGRDIALAGGNIAIGDLLTTAANGRVVKVTPGTDTTKYIVGQAVQAGADGDLIQIEVHSGTSRAA